MSIICHILGCFKILLTVIITWFVIQVWDALDIVIIITTTTLIMIIWSNKLSYLCTHADSVGKLTVGFQVLHPSKCSTFWAFWISPNQFFYTVSAKKGYIIWTIWSQITAAVPEKELKGSDPGFIYFFRNKFQELFQDSDWFFKDSKFHLKPSCC